MVRILPLIKILPAALLLLHDVHIYCVYSAQLCPQGFLYEPSRRCFWRSSIQDRQEIAEGNCIINGGQCAAIFNQGENDFIRDILPSLGVPVGEHLWIDINDLVKEGEFRYPNNTPITYSNWGDGEPSGSGCQDCVTVAATTGGTLEWYDACCDGQPYKAALCFMPAVEVTPTQGFTSVGTTFFVEGTSSLISIPATTITPTPSVGSTIVETAVTSTLLPSPSLMPSSTEQLTPRVTEPTTTQTAFFTSMISDPSCCAQICDNTTIINSTVTLEDMIKEMTVNKSSLSVTRRKKNCAHDDRTSAVTIGFVGVCVLSSVSVLLVVSDIMSLSKMMVPSS